MLLRMRGGRMYLKLELGLNQRQGVREVIRLCKEKKF